MNAREFRWVAEVLYLQYRFARFAVHFRIGLTDFTANHHGDHLPLADVADFTGANVTAVAQHGVVIGNGKDLVELVRDKQDGFALNFEAFDDMIKLSDFMLR